VPVTVPPARRDKQPSCLDRDEGVRPGIGGETLSRLRPVMAGGVVTEGKASRQNDAAAACLVVAEDMLPRPRPDRQRLPGRLVGGRL
jgi:acetyl-CoA C-acetyltransferase